MISASEVTAEMLGLSDTSKKFIAEEQLDLNRMILWVRHNPHWTGGYRFDNDHWLYRLEFGRSGKEFILQGIERPLDEHELPMEFVQYFQVRDFFYRHGGISVSKIPRGYEPILDHMTFKDVEDLLRVQELESYSPEYLVAYFKRVIYLCNRVNHAYFDLRRGLTKLQMFRDFKTEIVNKPRLKMSANIFLLHRRMCGKCIRSWGAIFRDNAAKELISRMGYRWDYETWEGFGDDVVAEVRRFLSDILSEEGYTLICMSFGLLDGERREPQEVAEHFGWKDVSDVLVHGRQALKQLKPHEPELWAILCS